MDYVRLGKSGLKVSRLTLGCMSFGDSRAGMHGWALGEEEARPFYAQALEGGINFFDTADVYSRGTSESITGKMLGEMARREDVVIATKVMGAMSADPNDRGLSRKHIMQAIDASLKRLGTDYVDLYQIHRFDDSTPIEETLEALEDIVRAGKALYIGASSMYAWQFGRMLAAQERNGWTRFASMQPQYSPAYREEEREMLPLCLAEGIGVIPWSPLAGGFLAHGRARPDEAETARSKLGSPHGSPFDNPASRGVFDAVSGIAKARGVSNATVVFAWLKTRPWITSPILGATKPHHLSDAFAGLALDLDDAELAAIDAPYRPREPFGLVPRVDRTAPPMIRALRWAGAVLLWAVVALCLLLTIVPQFLDRIYYRGPVSAHFDGVRFLNPDGATLSDLAPGNRGLAMAARAVFGDPDRPAWPDRVAVTPAKPPARVDGAAMLATWVGHATLLVQADGVNILTDPVWSATVGPFGLGPRRVAEPGVRIADLPKIDLILVSHDHYDHMDLTTLERLWQRDHPLIVTSLGNDSLIASTGAKARGLDWGQRIAVRSGIEVAVTRNHHWGSRWFADRNRALWSSFVVRMPHGNFFFAGDTGIGDGKWPAEAAALGPVRLAAIPIGAFRFEPGQMGADSHIGPWDAIRVWQGLGRPQAIPIHWGTFRLSWEGYDTPPRLLAAMLRCAGSDSARFHGVAIGQPVSIAPLSPPRPAPDMAGIDRCARAGAFDALR